MSKREIESLAKILTDPNNQDRTAEEVAELAIAALDEVRSRTHRLAVVGQISFSGIPTPSDPLHTVVLGPYSARGYLDTQDKFRRAVEGGSAARQAGQDLAWDSKTGKGRGRFQLVPAFLRPRAAWDFFRPEKEQGETLLKILQDVSQWRAGLWAEQAGIKPACHCGVRTALPCPRHATQGPRS